MAQTVHQFDGLLSQYGLNLTADELRQKRITEEQAKAMQAAKLTSGNPDALPYANIGAMLGGAIIGNRAKDEDTKRAQVALDAQAAFDAWKQTTPGATAADQSLQYQKFLGEAAFRNGFADIGSSIMARYDEGMANRKMRDMQFEKLGYDLTESKAKASIADYGATHQKWRWGQAEFENVFPMGSDDPNSGQRMRIDDEGNAVDRHGNIIYREGEWTSIRPEAVTSGTSSKGGKARSFKLTDSEAGQLRARQEAAQSMSSAAMRVDDLLRETVARGGKEQDVLGIPGQIAASANKIAFTIDGVMNNVGDMLGVPRGQVEVEIDEVDKKTGKKRTVMARDTASLEKYYGDEINNVVQKYLPNLNAKAANADLIRQQVLVIAGAIMRTREPGNSRFSDNDFKHSLELAGASLVDPQILRDTLRERVAEAYQSYDRARKQVPQEFWGEIWSEESIASAEADRKAFFDRFGQPGSGGPAPRPVSGTASSPVIQTNDGWSGRAIKN